MSPEAQRIAIAEACGWTSICKCGPQLDGVPPKEEGVAVLCEVPDYPNDLNAMHEAEKTLPDELSGVYFRVLYACNLYLIHGRNLFHLIHGRYPDYGDTEKELFAVSTATAAQRAEAFLRAIGKWEDDK